MRKSYEGTFLESMRQDNSLIVPTEADWLFASKILFWLTHQRRLRWQYVGSSPGMSQRMALDALLAASARRWKAAVVTENWRPLQSHSGFCDVQLIKASDFFADLWKTEKFFLSTPSRVLQGTDVLQSFASIPNKREALLFQFTILALLSLGSCSWVLGQTAGRLKGVVRSVPQARRRRA